MMHKNCRLLVKVEYPFKASCFNITLESLEQERRMQHLASVSDSAVAVFRDLYQTPTG